MACNNILMGKYYKYHGEVVRATLCQFCNGRRVTKYHECMFEGRGLAYFGGAGKVINTRIFGCSAHAYTKLEEATEEEYLIYCASKL